MSHSSQSNTPTELNPTLRNQWITANAVCFDVDSTVSCEEGIDVLAASCGVGTEVAAWTQQAMSGSLRFEDALQARLEIIKPSAQQLSECIAQHPPIYTPHIVDLIQILRQRGTAVYLVSGGFTQMITPLAIQLGLTEQHIFANTLLFHADGSYAGFDPAAFTARTGGKATALAWIKQQYHHQSLVMIGDGMTDLEARPPADLFIAYTGVQARPAVIQGADLACSDFALLISALALNQDA